MASFLHRNRTSGMVLFLKEDLLWRIGLCNSEICKLENEENQWWNSLHIWKLENQGSQRCKSQPTYMHFFLTYVNTYVHSMSFSILILSTFYQFNYFSNVKYLFNIWDDYLIFLFQCMIKINFLNIFPKIKLSQKSFTSWRISCLLRVYVWFLTSH